MYQRFFTFCIIFLWSINTARSNEIGFIYATLRQSAMSKRLMVIGWDSSDFALINPWMEEGYMPNLKKLMSSSKYGILKSVYPPATPMAWSNIVTGKNAGKHGLNGFMAFRPNSYEAEPVSSMNRKGKDVWEVLSSSGKKVAVVGVPLTYPVRKVNGCIISGFLTPSGSQEYCFPKNLKDEITAKVPGYTPSRPTYLAGEYNATSDEVYVKSLFDILEKHIEGMIFIAENKEWEFFMGVFNETDWVQHRFWSTIDKSHPKYDEMRARRFGNVIRDVHSRLDDALGDLLKIAEDASILVISDHGASPLHWNVNINYLLYKMGRLRFKRSIKSRIRVLTARMGFSPQSTFELIGKSYQKKNERRTDNRSVSNERSTHPSRKHIPFLRLGRVAYRALLLSSLDVDWGKTDAYASSGGNGAVFINVRGRFPDGIVDESEYHHLREEIVNNMRGLKFKKKDFIERIFVREELFNGEHMLEQPDIQLHFIKGYYGMGGFAFDLRRPFISPQTLSGIHGMNGIIVLREKGYDSYPSKLEDAQLVDIAPTILHIMGVPVPSDLDGKSLADTKEKLEIVKATPESSTISDSSVGYTKEEEEDIEQKLRSLGYI